jgi:thymidylate kinase
LYLLDALHLCEVVARARRLRPDVVIIDRYIYDQLANLPLNNPLSRIFARGIHSFVPRPDVAYLLDTDVEAARARKPEYPVEFMHKSRTAYMRLAGLLKTLTVIPAFGLQEAKAAVVVAFNRALARPRTKSELASDGAAAA